MRSLCTGTREQLPLTKTKEKPVQQQRPSTAINTYFFLKKEALILRKKRKREPSLVPVPMAWSHGQNLPVSNSGTRFLFLSPGPALFTR